MLAAAGKKDDVAVAVNAILDDGGFTVGVAHLPLREGATWPSTDSNVLFVRKCYKPMYENVLKQCQPVAGGRKSAQRHVITGQPGIGKSVFGCVCA